MQVLDSGHLFSLHCLDAPATYPSDPIRLRFVKREGHGYPGNVGHYPGTILQEVWRAEISRLKYLDQQIPCPQNTWCIENLRQCIFWLELRAAQRHGTEFVRHDLTGIEDLPICLQCGHIFPHTHTNP